MYNLAEKVPKVKTMEYIDKLPTLSAFRIGFRFFLIWAMPCVACFAAIVWIWRHF